MKSTTIKELNISEIMSVSGGSARALPPGCRLVFTLIGCENGIGDPNCRRVPEIVCD